MRAVHFYQLIVNAAVSRVLD